MPSKSRAQARLMAAAAHTPGGFGGVPQSVGEEFNQADKGGKLLSSAMRGVGRHERDQNKSLRSGGFKARTQKLRKRPSPKAF